jgi:integrase
VLAHLNAGGTYRRPTAVPFGQFAEQWLRQYAESAVKPSTLRRYRSLIICYLTPTFGTLLLTEITPERVQGFTADLVREHRCAPATANRALTLLKTMLRFARQWGHLRENPTQDVKPLRVESVEMDYLTPDDVRLLLAHADEPYRTVFLTAVLSGLRRSELLALQWGDIDWQSGVIHVRRSIWFDSRKELAAAGNTGQAAWRFLAPKSKASRRTVVLTPKLREALELHRLRVPASPHDLVFCAGNGEPIHPRNLIEREFWPTLTRAGLRRIRFHDLRHTYTALMIAQGFHAKFIQAQLGHASIQTTLDRYGHLLPDAQRAAGERLDALLFGERRQEVLTPRD